MTCPVIPLLFGSASSSAIGPSSSGSRMRFCRFSRAEASWLFWLKMGLGGLSGSRSMYLSPIRTVFVQPL